MTRTDCCSLADVVVKCGVVAARHDGSAAAVAAVTAAAVQELPQACGYDWYSSHRGKGGQGKGGEGRLTEWACTRAGSVAVHGALLCSPADSRHFCNGTASQACSSQSTHRL